MDGQSKGVPRVTVHYAQTLDGRLATRTGQSQWISGSAALKFAHQLRAEHQAVMVGVGTVLADNPRLTVRLVPGESPVRVIVDSTLRLPLDAHVLTDGAARTVVVTTWRAGEREMDLVRRRGPEVLVVDQNSSGQVDLLDLLHRLSGIGISSLLVEGGAAVITAALRAGLVDRLIVCIAPKVIGTGIEAVGDLDILQMSEALHFSQSSFTSVGEDVIFDGQFAHQQTVSLPRR